jgi:hypothetical protein
MRYVLGMKVPLSPLITPSTRTNNGATYLCFHSLGIADLVSCLFSCELWHQHCHKLGYDSVLAT